MVGNFMFFVDQIQVEPGLEEALAQQWRLVKMEMQLMKML